MVHLVLMKIVRLESSGSVNSGMEAWSVFHMGASHWMHPGFGNAG